MTSLPLAAFDFFQALRQGPWGIFFLCIGLVGQLVFGSRFIVQWVVSEKRKRSVIPVVFWYLSITGTLLLLTWALYRADIVFTLGQSANVFVYLRNLWLIQKHSQRVAERVAAGERICGDQHCGSENPEGALYCAFCGKPLPGVLPDVDPHARET